MRIATETATLTRATWHQACALDDIAPWTGVAALLGSRQIALIRWGEGEQVHALANFDPFSKAMVISRGIVGDLAGAPVIASPVHKQHFRLADGLCVEDPTVRLTSYPVRVVEGRVEVEL